MLRIALVCWRVIYGPGRHRAKYSLIMRLQDDRWTGDTRQPQLHMSVMTAHQHYSYLCPIVFTVSGLLANFAFYFRRLQAVSYTHLTLPTIYSV